MIQTIIAHTSEVDDAKVAVADILSQIDLTALKKNSVGIIHCYNEFADSGVLKAICKNLPFECVGMSSSYLASNSFYGSTIFALTVLTSDDCKFKSGVSAPVTALSGEPIKNLVEQVAGTSQSGNSQSGTSQSGEREVPKLLLTFLPLSQKVSGDFFIDKLNEYAPGIPAFGSAAATDEIGCEDNYTVFCGETFTESMALVAIYGNLNPHFHRVMVSKEKFLKQKAVITKITGNHLQRIDDGTTLAFLRKVNLIKTDAIDSSYMITFPFVAELPDGTRKVRSVMSATEEGGVLLAGSLPENTPFSIGILTSDDVLETAREMVHEILPIAEQEHRTILFYTCIARIWVMSMNSESSVEFLSVQRKIDDRADFLMSSSGSEIIPQITDDGKVINTLQNCSFVCCIL
ncbi:hypothetical protein AGMMS49938_13730 [Fibrobacterales bacterium]|nr:hypothetical protein AGMMS49938_13730 [Fibrobacterales bacterium]